MDVVLLRNAASALGELKDEVIFLGAATLPLWISDPGAEELRPTRDVDVVVEVTTRNEFNEFQKKLRGLGFRDEQTQIGRFLFGSDGMIDVIPADATILGFENYWQQASIPHSVEVSIEDSVAIRVLQPPNLLATKLEAYRGRGNRDPFASKDFEDIVRLIDGREELPSEVQNADTELREYLSGALRNIYEDPRFVEACSAHIGPDESSERRANEITIPRIERIIEIGLGSETT